MEQITLTTPISAYRVLELVLDWQQRIVRITVGLDDVVRRFTYTDPIATTLMQGLNKANLSTVSLHRRILERLVADGYLAGSITGTPD